MTARFTGKTAVVTGGGSGIGLATATRLASEGASLLVLDARADAAQEAADQIHSAGGTAVAHTADVGDEASVAAAMSLAAHRFGGIDMLVACAGIARVAVTHELALEGWELMLRVNLTGTFLAVKHALPFLLARPTSAVVTIGSVGSLVAAGGTSAYDASKGGVLQFTRAVAVEYVNQGLRANCICPGVVATGLRANSTELHGASSVVRDLEPSARLRIPMERRADPSEIAGVVAFLCSDDASFITGAAIAADGGYTAI
jgi:NAD(P)-dependent dehydrogenase (short-subunit alcohol dehydrogenase family)